MRRFVICCSVAAIFLLLRVADVIAQPVPDPVDPPDTVYATGVIPESPDAIARFTRAPTFRNFLPESIDLSRNFPTPGNQGRQGSCVGWSVAYAARAYYVAAGEGRPLSQSTNIPSPAYIYNLGLARSGRSNCGQGMLISEALDMLKTGAVSLADYPYDEGDCSPPPSAIVNQAVQFPIKDWQFIDPRNLDTIKGELSQGNPIVFGMRLSNSFHQHRGSRVHERLGSLNEGGHAMVLIGYDESRQAFRLQNSWGSRWGDRGYAWLSYSTFSKDAFVSYVMRPHQSVPRPGPGPGPDPRPAPEVVLRDIDCAKVTVVSENGKRVARGFVGKREDLDKVRDKIKDAEIAVDVRPWPQCEALLTLDRALSAPDAPRIAIAGTDGTFVRGDNLSFQVSAPRAPSHLHVVYFQADGSVVHLVQADAQNLRTFDGGARLTFGDGREGRAAFRVSPPFGNEMALVLASRSPIFAEPRPRMETEREFLSALRRALLWKPDAASAERGVSAAFVAVTTRDK